MTLVCSVMAWGTEEIEVDNFADLKAQLSADGTADVVKLKNDIAYPANGNASYLLNIERSLTLDGQGHKITGWSKANIGINYTSNEAVTLAVNYGGATSAALDVTIQNLTATNNATGSRSMALIAYDGVNKLNLLNDSLIIEMKASWVMGLLVTGADATPLQLKIEDSFVTTGDGKGYPAYFCKPIAGTFKNTEFKGYCALYFKYRASAAYGQVVGPRGSVINADACTFTTLNYHNTKSNGFAVFAIEDDGITLNLHNCSGNAKQTGTQKQSMISLQWKSRTEGFQKVAVNITGDNSHYYNFQLPYFALTGWNTDDDDHPDDYKPSIDVPFELNISGGTFAVDPSQIKYHTYADGGNGYNVEYAYIDPAKYEVKEVNQGGATLYRVVPLTTTLYNLNSDVQDEGNGQNPTTSFDLSTGEEMTLNQATTKAGYVEVSDNGDDATIVKVGKTENPGTPSETKVDQTLVINNGLDVQGDSKVDVQAGSTLVIGEGGIVTSKPENIVIEADRAGAASLIMDPAITVNQTPELTVRMTAQQTGKIGDDEFWHRFAMPVQHADSWTKEGSLGTGSDKYPTYLYGWNYSSDSWYKLPGGVSDMQAFMGYTLRLATEETSATTLQDVVYIFKGQLAGNTNNTLQFSRNGYNFFGNSYTGYIDLKQLVAQITGDSKIEGTAWVWNTNSQRYQDVPLNLLADGAYDGESDKWKTEIAPMQTFILKQNGSENASTEINYASAVWGNPRYSAATGVAAAPARRVADMNTTRMYIAVTAANGQSDEVFFVEDANYSDAFDNGYDASKYMNPNTINVFANQNGIDLGTVASDNLNGKTLSLKTNGELAYTMSFKNVEGEEYAIRDNVTGAVINIEEGATYEFAAQPNSTIEGRFEIVGAAKIPTAIDNTEVKANVKGIYTIMGQYLGENFDILPAGVYVVNGVKIVK